MSQPILLWFRQNLRLGDNEALYKACQQNVPVIPVFIWDEAAEADWPIGAASKAWLARSLEMLERQLQAKQSRLIVLKGSTKECLKALIKETQAQAVYCQRRYEPKAISLETSLSQTLSVPMKLFNGALLHQPEQFFNKQGKPYQVYTPFWKALSQTIFHTVSSNSFLPEPPCIPAPSQWPQRISIMDLPLLPPKHEPHWDVAILQYWNIGEHAAKKQLKMFIAGAVANYEIDRNYPATSGTSRLSPALHFGEISPRQVWVTAFEALMLLQVPSKQSIEVFLKELVWREFSHYLLYHFPQTPMSALKAEFNTFPWEANAEFLECWQKGETGYPIIDAGMRELWATGWMHNRVRMIVASFLVKNLLMPWQEGARWFWDTLVDADLAQNTLGWQWVAGCGADAAPYFRIFNPVLQGEKFNPAGHYVKHWIPELATASPKFIHKPWEQNGSLFLPAYTNYPNPIVDLSSTRDRALSAYKKMRLPT